MLCLNKMRKLVYESADYILIPYDGQIEPKQGLPAKNGCSLSSERPLARAPANSNRAMSTLAETWTTFQTAPFHACIDSRS